VLATITAGTKGGSTHPWELAIVVSTSVVVLWLAHVYAHSLGESITAGRPVDRRLLGTIAVRELPIALSAVAPVLALALAGLEVIDDSTGVWLAVALCLVTLLAQGLRYARIERLGGGATLVVVAANLLLGLAIVLLKVAVAY